MTNLRPVAAGVLVTVAAIAGAGGAADAAPVAKEVMLVNVKTGKCLTIAGGTLADNNIAAVQFDCDGDPSRRWRLAETRRGIYQIRNVKTGKCLTIAGGVSKENNVTALQFDCDDDPSRTWRFDSVSDGSYQIRNVQTDKCLTIAGGTLSDNNIESVQFDCDDDTSRRWTLKTASAASPQSPPPGGTPAAPAYRISGWSGWSRTAGIEYRYRWGWNPQDSTEIDAIFQIRNLQNQVWHGAARSLDCSRNALSRGTNVDLPAGQTREVKFRTPNCGTATNPSFRPNVVQSGTL